MLFRFKLVERGVYASIAVMLVQKNGFSHKESDKMDKNHSMDVLNIREDRSVTMPHLSVLTEWADDMKQWPNFSYIDIVNYLIFSEGVDGEELRSYKSIQLPA